MYKNKLMLSASRVEEIAKAAAKYSIEKNVSFHKVYVLVDTGINAGVYVISDEEWDYREKVGLPHPIPSSESLPHGGERLGAPQTEPKRSGISGKPLYPDMRPGESKTEYWKRKSF